MAIEGNVWQGGEHSPASKQMMAALGTPRHRAESAEDFIARVDRESRAYVATTEAQLSLYQKFLRGITMKKLLIAVSIATVALFSCHAYAQVKCAPDGRGGMCCWDINTQGPFKPIGC